MRFNKLDLNLLVALDALVSLDALDALLTARSITRRRQPAGDRAIRW